MDFRASLDVVEKSPMSLRIIKPRSLGRPAHSLFAIPNRAANLSLQYCFLALCNIELCVCVCELEVGVAISH
jgi:hypothetical protein